MVMGIVSALAVICVLCTVDAQLSAGKTRLVVKHAYGDTAVMMIQDDRVCVIVDGGNAWTAAKNWLKNERLSVAEAVVLTDEYRKITRKWNEFDDAIEVSNYYLLRPEDTTKQTLSQSGVPVTVIEGEVPLFDNGVLSVVENSVMVTFDDTATVLCPTEKAKRFLPMSFQKAKRFLYLDDTDDVSLTIG